MEKKFTKDTIMAKILEDPRAEEVLIEYNVPCFHCPLAATEMESITIGEVASAYNLDLEDILKNLNK